MVKNKLGILGGTFDPVHLGHIKIAEEVIRSLGIDEVIFVPAGQPMSRHKKGVTAAEHRLRMLEIALEGQPGMALSKTEIERPGPSFTVDTMDQLRRQYKNKSELFFIVGWDSLEQIPNWKEPGRLIELCYIVAAPRPGWTRPETDSLEKKVPGITRKLIYLEAPYLDISATAIKDKIYRGESIENLVPSKVAEYIKKNNLYIKAGDIA